MRLRFLIPLTLCLATPLAAQSAPALIYAESFRQGPSQIVEQRFEVKLTPKDPLYRERIKDSRGADRYIFSITPFGPEGDTEITCWQARLTDLHHPIYDNLLLTTQEPSSDPKNALWRLDPSRFALIPWPAKRIIKVESFYLVLQVKAFHFTPPDAPYLDSMTVAVEFTDADPRSVESIRK
jgi:hypothetical protein